MAQGATVYKIDLTFCDPDNDIYFSEKLVLARHPSETEERMCARLLAYLHQGDETLEYTRGLCVRDEPELWSRDNQGQIRHWVEMGQVDVKRLQKAARISDKVSVYLYQKQATIWWERHRKNVTGLKNLSVYCWAPETLISIIAHLSRNMELAVTRYDTMMLLNLEGQVIEIWPKTCT